MKKRRKVLSLLLSTVLTALFMTAPVMAIEDVVIVSDDDNTGIVELESQDNENVNLIIENDDVNNTNNNDNQLNSNEKVNNEIVLMGNEIASEEPDSQSGTPSMLIANEESMMASEGNIIYDNSWYTVIDNSLDEISDKVYTMIIKNNTYIDKTNWKPSSTTFAQDICTVVLEEGVTIVSKLNNLPKLKEVILPSTITTIDKNAFNQDASLESINIPYGVQGIGEYCFYRCTSLKNIFLPDTITSIGNYAFSLSGLETLNIYNNNGNLYQNEEGTLHFSPSVTDIGEHAFERIKTKKVIFEAGNSMTNLQFGRGAFVGCSDMASFILNRDCAELALEMFSTSTDYTDLANPVVYACSSLKDVVLPNSLGLIGKKAFENCSALQTFNFPESESLELGDYAFSGCSSLKTLNFKPTKLYIDTWVFFECPELESVVFPVSTYKIGDQAFRRIIRATFLDGDTSCFSANNTQRSFAPGTTIISAPGTHIRHDAYLNGFKWEALGTYDLSTAGVGNNKKVDVTFDFAEYTGKPVTPLKTVRVNANPDKYAEGILLTKDVDYTVTYSNNINAGTGIATITGKGDYTGSITREFTITGSGTPTTQSISNATMTLPYTTKEYTGVELKPEPTVKLDSKTLVANTDYTVSYKNNKVAGTATVTATGIGGYSGTVSKTFTITKVPMTSSRISVADIASQTYTGNAITPKPVVKVGNTVMTEGTHYSLAYRDNTNPGTATVEITGIGNYTGMITKTFTITGKSIANAVVENIANVTYTGSAIKPSVTVKYDNVALVKDTDYTVSYKNNINAGTATAVITGKNVYSGTIEKTFTIVAKSISTATIENIPSAEYTGAAIKPAVTVKDGTKTLSSDDYTVSYNNNVNVGTASVTITGKGNYKETLSKNFEITARNISSAKIEDIADVTYTGNNVTPSVTVTYGGKALANNTDYTVAYSNNKEIGTATVTVTGKGNYTGEATKTFKIVAMLISGATIENIPDATYIGSAIIPSVVVKDGTKTLKKDTDYTVSANNNVNVGTATLTIEGKGIYGGTVDKTFKIIAKPLSKDMIEVASATYTGSKLTPDVTVKDGDKTLVKGTDYKVEYYNNVKASDTLPTAKVSGLGNYSGTVNKTFVIEPKSISNVEVILADAYLAGDEILPVVKDGATTLVKDTDYTVEIKEKTLVITGLGNYTGTANKLVTILERAIDISEVSVNEIPAVEYSGKAYKPELTVTMKTDGETKTLEKNVDYTVTYKNNVNAGTATAIITGMRIYDGTKEVTYKIKPRELYDNVSVTITGATSKEVYQNGKPITKTPTVTYIANNKKQVLVKDRDYKLTYQTNINTGRAGVFVTGIGNYKSFVKKNGSYVEGGIARYFAIHPKQAYISKLTTPKTKQITVTWGKRASITGYEVQVSKVKNFAASKTQKFIVRDPKKSSHTFTVWYSNINYYVRVRTFKEIYKKDGTLDKVYYGLGYSDLDNVNWSVTKTIKSK